MDLPSSHWPTFFYLIMSSPPPRGTCVLVLCGSAWSSNRKAWVVMGSIFIYLRLQQCSNWRILGKLCHKMLRLNNVKAETLAPWSFLAFHLIALNFVAYIVKCSHMYLVIFCEDMHKGKVERDDGSGVQLILFVVMFCIHSAYLLLRRLWYGLRTFFPP